MRWPTVSYDETTHERFDVMIELGGQIGPGQTDALKHSGGRLVSYCCGSEYVHAAESILFDKPTWKGQLFINQRYDDIWMVPQVEHTSRSYFEVLRRQQARAVPFVWSPVFLEERARQLPHGGLYQAHAGARRLSVMEPNINTVKFCLYPALIAEQAYRAQPDAIALLQVTNAEQLAKENLDFIALMTQLDLVQDHKAVFLGRHETPRFLAEHTDIVVSHQLGNPLNYFYLEVCWQGYPLVHNAHLCADLGYYYAGNDALAGARCVLQAIETHDAQATAYREHQRALIARYAPDNADVTATYSRLLEEVVSRPAR